MFVLIRKKRTKKGVCINKHQVGEFQNYGMKKSVPNHSLSTHNSGLLKIDTMNR